jgi:hypothetical protein
MFDQNEGHEAVQQHLMGPHWLQNPGYGSQFELLLKIISGL